jgi:hypothetical protein
MFEQYATFRFRRFSVRILDSGEEITVMTKVVIIMHVLQTEAKTKLGMAGRKAE